MRDWDGLALVVIILCTHCLIFGMWLEPAAAPLISRHAVGIVAGVCVAFALGRWRR